MIRRFNCIWLPFLLGISLPALCQQREVTIGAQVWTYERLYPLLDGLFQDAASTQVQQLTLNPNTANSAQLDALIQSFQLQAGFSQLAGVQNSAAAQMTLANLGYQASLAQEQENITQQSIAAQQALTKANQDLATATASGNQAAISSANLEVANAQALVTGLSAEATTAKGSGTPWTPSAASGNIAATPSTFTSGVPTTLLSSGSQSGGPSFPATKMMDNQMDLLWSRLARVVGSMSRPDSINPSDRFYLIEFDTGTFPHKDRKGKLLETRYGLTCGQVVDLYPRVAAVNVANTKYRDNADIFGVMLSWFSFGINAGYNREHLKMSQTLGQESYITGYGVDQSVFGWRFGIQLGDNFVSSDTKRTFALISAPQGCVPTLDHFGVWWEDSDGRHQRSDTPVTNFADYNAKIAQVAQGGSAAGPVAVQSISFNRASYDATKYSAANPVLVSLSVQLGAPIDQQATLYANGILLKRARDTFGRAIPNGNGSGGLLEESTSIAQANTWMPVSPNNLLITLDAGQFGATFPTIQIASPGAAPSSISSLTQGAATISGQALDCSLEAGKVCHLPSLAYQVPASSAVGAFLWQKTKCTVDHPEVCDDEIVVQAPPIATASSAQTGTTTQVVSGAATSPWGASSEVYVQFPGSSSQKLYRLDCGAGESAATQSGSLVCKFWDKNNSGVLNSLTQSDVQIQVIDQGHVGGALVAKTSLQATDWRPFGNPAPTLWSASNPQWHDDHTAAANGGYWDFQIQFANVDDKPLSPQLIVSPTPPGGDEGSPVCSDTRRICSWTFKIQPTDLTGWTNRMELGFAGDPDDAWQLLNIWNQISPLVTVMSSDFTSWSGANFTSLFESTGGAGNTKGLSIGGNLYHIDCPTVNYCKVLDSLSSATAAPMYLQTAPNHLLPLLQLNADGSTTPISFQPPKSGAPQNSAQVAPNAPTSPTALMNLRIQPGPASQILNTFVIGGSKK
ncbi:MAG TPA: hypothetical protein VG893_06280 [Terracidiphilus sp.]|nr:hypothetical protein [Terracidiphilus sp.]